MIQRTLARGKTLLRAPFLRGVAVIASGTALAQVMPVLLTPILTRLYSPSDMGLLGLYTAFISFAANATTLGYSQAIVTGKTDDEGADLTKLSALVVVPMSLVAAGIMLFLTKRNSLGFGELPWWTAIAMAVSLVFTGLFFTLRYWLVRVGDYPVISTAAVAQSIGRMATQIALGIVGLGWVGLLLGEVLGRAAGLGRMWSAAKQRLVASFSVLGRSHLLLVARTYRKFPLLTMPSSLINSLALVLPVPLLTTFFSVQEAGQFSVATRVMLIPVSLVGMSVGDVFHSRIAQISREAPQRAERLFLKVAVALICLGIGPIMLVRVFGEDLFAKLLGSEWELAGVIAASITPWVLMQFAVSPVSRIVQVFQGQELKLVYDLCALVSVFGVIWLGGSQEWSLEKTCIVLGWSQALVYLIYFILLIRMIRRYVARQKWHDIPAGTAS